MTTSSVGVVSVGALEDAASSAATATTLSGPSSGTVSVASSNFTVGANGSITGTVYKCLPNDMAIKAGTFKIGADGTILRAHSILKEFARKHMRKLQARVYLY